MKKIKLKLDCCNIDISLLQDKTTAEIFINDISEIEVELALWFDKDLNIKLTAEAISQEFIIDMIYCYKNSDNDTHCKGSSIVKKVTTKKYKGFNTNNLHGSILIHGGYYDLDTQELIIYWSFNNND